MYSGSVRLWLSSISKILRAGFHGATILVSQTIPASPQCLRIVLFNLTIAPSPNILFLNSSAILPWDDRNILTPTPFPLPPHDMSQPDFPIPIL